MACSQTLSSLFIFSFITICYAALDPFKLSKPNAIHFPIRKNQTTLQYYTTYESGNPQSRTTIDALIDLGAQSVWFECTSYVSSTYKRASCGSNRCKKAKGTGCIGCDSAPRPGCSNNTCAVYGYNPFTEYLTAQELGEDTMRVTSTDGQSILLNYDIPKFQFSCADPDIVEGLPGDHTKGLVGLARTDVSLPLQISSSLKLAQKFALCLPSSSDNGLGDIFIGGGPYYMPPSTEDQSLSFISTPLVINPVSTAPMYNEGDASDEYFINVKAIEISGKPIALNSSLLSFDKNGFGGTKISTIVPYTALHSTIYKSLVKDFIKAATKNNIKRVTSVAPFGACFDSKTAPKTITGPAVPDIDLILEGNTTRFRIYGSNSMVEAQKNVICLAFIDGGAEPRTSIVLGGHQLENRILEFDVGASMLGITSSLLVWNTSCSHYRSSYLKPQVI
uniref:probable aspartic proteinase GIP2 n=1 Tax=Erigeron canadensis TaxID=72917 RepID=UPI001CB94819|nr:probable aspartic proteinase GIP2 [Erigeron canadensis]